jgi:PAS domain S-box-containing protein
MTPRAAHTLPFAAAVALTCLIAAPVSRGAEAPPGMAHTDAGASAIPAEDAGARLESTPGMDAVRPGTATEATRAPILVSLRWTPWIVLITWVLIGAGVAAAVRSVGRAEDNQADRTDTDPTGANQPQVTKTGEGRRTDELWRVHSAALHAAANPIVIGDQLGRITWVNSAFTAMTGYPADEAIGHDLMFLSTAPERTLQSRELWETVQAGSAWYGETTNRRKDGTVYTEAQTVTPVGDDDGAITHVISIKQDISAGKRTEAELEAAKHAADAANRAKDEFLALVGNEVRAPLDGIIGMIELVLRTPLDDKQREYLDLIETTAAALQSVVHDFLGMATSEAGEVRNPAGAPPWPALAAPATGNGSAETHGTPTGSASVPRLRVLLAEDNPVNQRIIVCMLEERGHAVVATHSGQEALQALSTQPFDVVLMDVQMPEMDGLRATAEIRKREAQPLALPTSVSALRRAHLPIIAITAHAMRGYRERCLAAGMDGCVTKPFDPHELCAAVESAAAADAAHSNGSGGGEEEEMVVHDPHAATPAAATHGGSAPAATPASAVIDRSALAERLDSNVGLLNELIGLFAQHAPKLLADIRMAIGRADRRGLEMHAHSVKGTLANLGADRAAAIASRLEHLAPSGSLTEAAATYTVLEEEVANVRQALAELARAAAPFGTDAAAA